MSGTSAGAYKGWVTRRRGAKAPRVTAAGREYGDYAAYRAWAKRDAGIDDLFRTLDAMDRNITRGKRDKRAHRDTFDARNLAAMQAYRPNVLKALGKRIEKYSRYGI